MLHVTQARTYSVTQTVGKNTFARTLKNIHLCLKIGELGFVFLQTRQIPYTACCKTKRTTCEETHPNTRLLKTIQRGIWRGCCEG